MPKRTDLRKILIIGSGPIVIGQACEFDYSGTQACKALRAEGYTVVLVNSNPATIMTDPEIADRTYVEPLTAPSLEKIIAAERPDAVLPTVGGQTGLNAAVELAERGILDKYGVQLIGASLRAIKVAEENLLGTASTVTSTATTLAVPKVTTSDNPSRDGMPRRFMAITFPSCLTGAVRRWPGSSFRSP